MGRKVSEFGIGLFFALTVALTACGDDDAPPAESTDPGSGDAAAVLSADPVDQINFILAQSAVPIPGEAAESRYQVRLIPGDSLAVDFEQHQLEEPWYAGATAYVSLDVFRVDVSGGRNVRLVCETERCIEYRTPLDELDLRRLPEGPGRDRFLGILSRLSLGETTVEAEGGEDEINRLLRESAVSFSETVSSWYQVSFSGDWMREQTWQYTEGFTEHTTAGTRLVHLPGLAPVDPSRPVTCREAGCILDLRDTPIRFVPPDAEHATRLAALISRLQGG